MLSPKLSEALGMTSQKINDINCVKFIWWHFYQMYRILRKNTAQLKPGHPSSSTNVEDCEFGLHDSEISRYVYRTNMFHALMIFRYDCKEVTPYMMKFVDVFPKHLCSTPFKALMRVATEGGEQTHYMHICFYYQVCKTNIYKWLLVLTSVGSSSLLSYSWQNLSLCFQHSTRHLFWFHESRWMPPTFQRKYLAICWSYHGFHQFGY